MTVCRRERRSTFGLLPFVLFAASAMTGCYGDCDGCSQYYSPPPPPGNPPPSCESGVGEGSVDTGALLDLEPGEGVGTTVEYLSEGAWRFAVTCDSLVSGVGCNWSVLVAPIDGVIDDYEPEALELDDGTESDVIERYPTMAGSLEEDGVWLNSFTDEDIDAFTVFATPDIGMFVSVAIDGHCGGPFLFWTDGGEVRSSQTEATELFPQ
jgi:hypothetical protein